MEMTQKIIAIASDHAGFELRGQLHALLKTAGYQVLDLGTDSTESVDYPDFASKVAQAITSGQAAQGVLVCGSGIGMSIAANRYQGIRAALCHDVTTARLARQHNDANILCLGARILGAQEAGDTLRAFLETPFEGGRHQRRVDKMG